MTAGERWSAWQVRGPRAWPYMAVAVLVTMALVTTLVVQRNHLQRSEALRAAAERSFARREQQADLLSILRDAESAQRGYLLTGDPSFLRAYRATRKSIAQCLASPAKPFASAPQIAGLVAMRIDILDRAVALAQAGRHAQAVAIVADRRGRQVMNRLWRTINEAMGRETKGNEDRRRDASTRRNRLYRSTLLAGAGTMLLFGALYMLWQRRRLRHARQVADVEAAARHTTILDSTIDAILIVSPAGSIETMNAAACTMLGYRTVEMRGRDINTIVNIAPGEGSFDQRVGLRNGELGRSYLSDRPARQRDGQVIPVDVALGVMRLPGGDHLIVSLRDITERKRVENAKDELISTVSHELRTPLTSVVGSLGLLRAGAAGTLPPGAARLVEIADSNSRRLIRLINDMLDIERVESGCLTFDRGLIDLRHVVEQACTGSEGLARGSGLELICEVPDEPVPVHGDEGRLVQVVGNLVSNAIRVSPAGAPVRIDLVADGRGRAVVRVEDRGPGVPFQFRQRIFGRFERAFPHDGSAGTGLGLAAFGLVCGRRRGHPVHRRPGLCPRPGDHPALRRHRGRGAGDSRGRVAAGRGNAGRDDARGRRPDIAGQPAPFGEHGDPAGDLRHRAFPPGRRGGLQGRRSGGRDR
ncbi:PAS domain S-box protein [Sphingomonas aracearum]|uniref:histidine kinase n=1 Tax=Sphingomonas aracearum TaxID=2283317 RepID=A0A369W454_9SPHN|nr:PAS domain S-box protein [Sphingomonas aracearum]